MGYPQLEVALMARHILGAGGYGGGTVQRGGLVGVIQPETPSGVDRRLLGDGNFQEDSKTKATVVMRRALVAAASANEFPGIDRRFVLRAIHVCRPPIEFAEELKDHADADPWLQQMVLGEAALQKAKTVQGGPNATEEPTGQESSAGGPQLAEAPNIFAQAVKLQPTYPEGDFGMMQAAVAGGKDPDEVRRWFDRAVAAKFDWTPPYALMRMCLADQRDLKRLYAFGRECLKTGRYDSGVPNNFILVLDDIERILGSSDFMTRPGIYQNARVFFNGATKDGETKHSVYLASLEFLTAYRAGQFADAAKAFERVQGQVDRYLLEQRGVDPTAAIAQRPPGQSLERPHPGGPKAFGRGQADRSGRGLRQSAGRDGQARHGEALSPQFDRPHGH